jgi:hypothetical protein
MSIIGLDQPHAALVAHRTRITGLEPSTLAVGLRSLLGHGRHVGHRVLVTLSQQGATLGQLGVAMAVREEAEVSDFMQALGQNVEGESAQKFDRVEGLGTQLAPSLVVFEAEGEG